MTAPTVGLPALATVNLLIAQGTDYTCQLQYQAGSPATPVNLTGWAAHAQLRTAVGGDVWLQLDTGGNGITLDGSGNVTVAIGHAATSGTVWNGRTAGVWDLQLVDPSGNVTRLVQGVVTISPAVTR